MKKYISILFTVLVSTSFIHAATSNDVAIILKSMGDVRVGIPKPKQWLVAKKGMHLNSGNVIKTRDDGYAAVMFSDDKSLLKIRENSTVAIGGKREKKAISKRLRFNLGQLWLKVRKKQTTKFVIETPSGMATVKGTEFYGIVDENGKVTFICIEGLISLMNKLGDILIKAGETGEIGKNTAPSKHKTKDSDIPDWGNESGDGGKLEFEFEDADGKKKVIQIEYEDK